MQKSATRESFRSRQRAPPSREATASYGAAYASPDVAADPPSLGFGVASTFAATPLGGTMHHKRLMIDAFLIA